MSVCKREREREEKQRKKETKTETQRENARLRNPTGRTVRDHSHLCSVKAHQRSHTSVTSSLYYSSIAAVHRIEEKPIWCTEEQNSCVIVPMFWTYVVDDLFFFSGMLNRELSLSACTLVLRSSSSDSQFLFIFFISFWN